MVMTYIVLISMLFTSVVSGVAQRRKEYPLALFAMFWTGYNFCLFVTKVIPL
jgi:hypothetical protein